MNKMISCIGLMLVLLLCFTACGDTAVYPSEESPSGGGTGKGEASKEKLPYIADYTKGDIRYEVTLSDGVRSVTLSVSRTGVVSECEVVSPEALVGISFISDAAGLRIRSSHTMCDDVAVSDIAAAGLEVVFGIMSTPFDGSMFKGGRGFETDVNGIPVTVVLSPDGFPESAVIGEGNAVRHLKFEPEQIK